MRLYRSILYRLLRFFGVEGASRPDLVPQGDLKRWRMQLEACNIERDLEVRGLKDSLSLLDMGKEVAIDRQCIFWLADEDGAGPSISLGDRVYVGPFCYLGSFAPLSVGRDTIIGAYSYLISGNHRSSRRDIPYRDQGYEGAPICIGNNVWLGCHVVVLPGVTIGDGAIVGAGAVVTKDIPEGETWGGVPARLLSCGDQPKS